MAGIELRGLTKRFDALLAVDSVDLDVGPGEVVCLLGPSGCGKTTTLRMVAGLEFPSAGAVRIDGRDVVRVPARRRDVAMVFQFYALYPSLTVAENIAFPLHAERLPGAEARSRVARVAEMLDLGAVLDRRPDELAEGEKQRVAVARAVVREPSCFLFDEPLSRLDVQVRETMRGQIKEVLSGLARPTVIVTHDQLEALTMADRIAVMRDGRIQQAASPHDIFTRPANVFVAGFIGTPQMNLLPGRLEPSGEGGTRVVVGDRSLRVAGAHGPGEVTVGFRPRSLEITPEPGGEALEAVVDLIEPMGAEVLVHLRCGSHALRMVCARGLGVREGEALRVRPGPDQVHLFDPGGDRVAR